MEISIITYDHPHLKTAEIVSGLYFHGHRVRELLALPFAPRPERDILLTHRPDQTAAPHNADIAHHHGIAYRRFDHSVDIETEAEVLLVAVGALIPANVLERTRVINCHAGLIPTVRGLDAFKWAIHEDKPLGVSLHLIDAEIDAGDHLASIETPIYASDTPESLSLRHYRLEIDMCIDFQRHLANPSKPLYPDQVGVPHKRMPARIEEKMLAKFGDYVHRRARPTPL